MLLLQRVLLQHSFGLLQAMASFGKMSREGCGVFIYFSARAVCWGGWQGVCTGFGL